MGGATSTLATVGIVGGLIAGLVYFRKPILDFVGSLAGEFGNALLSGVGGGGLVQTGTQYTITDPNTGQTETHKVPTGTQDTYVSPNPSLNLVDPNTGKLINLSAFQNKYPTLYDAISKINLPSDYEKQYVSGKINTQPISYSSAEKTLTNIEEFQANIALGANPESGEFGSKYFYVAGSKNAVPLTPYEINYDIAHGIKLVEAVH